MARRKFNQYFRAQVAGLARETTKLVAQADGDLTANGSTQLDRAASNGQKSVSGQAKRKKQTGSRRAFAGLQRYAQRIGVVNRLAAICKKPAVRVVIVFLVVAAASAVGLTAIKSSLFLYLLYVALSLLVGAVATSTLIWMLHAWRTPGSLAESRLEADGRESAYSFSLIVPARHEEAVLETTLSRLISTDHPAFEVVVVVGADDVGTREVAERVADRNPERVKVVVDPSWPKSKPKALNAGLPHCSATITGVFDAEDDVHPALLRRVDQCFQSTNADIVQAGVQLMNFRSSWFTVHNVLEYYFWFRSRLHVHARQRFIPLGGNTVFIRTSILRAVGGWVDCLTEDCEIGVRLSALGARTAVFYEPELVTREECPPTVGDFVRQRTRWNQGFLQTLARGYWRRLPLRQRALGAYILASPYVMALAWLMVPAAIATAVAVKAPIVITLLSFLPLVPMLAMLAVDAVGLGEFCRAYGQRPSVRDFGRLVLGILPYQGLLAYAAVRAVVRQARGARGWDKTTHLGLHRGRPARVDAGSAMTVSKLPQRTVSRSAAALVSPIRWAAALRSAPLGALLQSSKEARRATPITEAVQARPETHALAESLVGSQPIVEAQADALAARGVDLSRGARLVATSAADVCQASNGHANSHPLSIDDLFGQVGAAPLWTRLNNGQALKPASHSPKRSRLGDVIAKMKRLPGSVRDLLRQALTRHVDLVLLLVLLIVAGLVTGTNLLHWPATEFDEGTYVGQAWSVQHGRLDNYTYGYGHPPLAWLLIFFWTEAAGLFGPTVFSIDHGREFMLVICLVSCWLLYLLARRLEFSRLAAATTVILFALCPLGIFFHRAVLLDNPSTVFAIAAFLLAWTPQHRLWAFAGSGACFALCVLCKETTFNLLPALMVAVAQNADRRTRRYCVMLFFAFFVLVGGFYPLYATLKGELLPGRGHVSLIGYLGVQLFTRKGTGSLFSPFSQTHAIVESWLQLDPWLLGAALALAPVALARRSTRAVALGFLIQASILFRPGYLPNMYVIAMLPFAALIVPGSIEALWRWARRIRFPSAMWAIRAAVAALACTGVLLIAPRWAHGDRTAMTLRQDGPERATEQWLLDHVGHDKRLIVGDQFWIYLIEHGFNDQPMPGGFFSKTVVFYWTLDYDPAVKRAFPDAWRDFNYVVVNQGMIDTLDQNPTTAAAINHSRVVASFGQGLSNIQVRQIATTGR